LHLGLALVLAVGIAQPRKNCSLTPVSSGKKHMTTTKYETELARTTTPRQEKRSRTKTARVLRRLEAAEEERFRLWDEWEEWGLLHGTVVEQEAKREKSKQLRRQLDLQRGMQKELKAGRGHGYVRIAAPGILGAVKKVVVCRGTTGDVIKVCSSVFIRCLLALFLIIICFQQALLVAEAEKHFRATGVELADGSTQLLRLRIGSMVLDDRVLLQGLDLASGNIVEVDVLDSNLFDAFVALDTHSTSMSSSGCAQGSCCAATQSSSTSTCDGAACRLAVAKRARELDFMANSVEITVKADHAVLFGASVKVRVLPEWHESELKVSSTLFS
jgi:hypothetical protein